MCDQCPPEDGNPEEVGFIPLDKLSEAFAARRELLDRKMMENQADSHAIYDLLNRLAEADLDALTKMMVYLAHNPEGAVYYLGYLTKIQEEKHKICPACRLNHDEQLSEISNSDATPDT